MGIGRKGERAVCIRVQTVTNEGERALCLRVGRGGGGGGGGGVCEGEKAVGGVGLEASGGDERAGREIGVGEEQEDEGFVVVVVVGIHESRDE